MKLYMFRTDPLSIIRSFSLYTQQWYMSYRFADSCGAGSGWNCVPSWSCCTAVCKLLWYMPLLCVQWKTPDDGQRNCPKHVEFHSENKFEKLVHLVGFIIRSNTAYTQTRINGTRHNAYFKVAHNSSPRDTACLLLSNTIIAVLSSL